jgi:hypothetical protein
MFFRNSLALTAAFALIAGSGLAVNAQTAPAAAAKPSAAVSAAPPASGTPAPGTSATTGALRGRAVDATNAVIPGVTITLSSTSGQTFTTTSTGDGTYLIPNVTPGSYTLNTQVAGFSPLTRDSVVITAATATRVTLHLQPAVTATVTVTADNTQQLSVASDANASTLTLTGKDLDALSDDPDELSDELNALAGPAAGPNGGQIYIDGFTGGTLPPKSSIREIRINQNPFSAQYDRVGFGRIEVFTKPGTDKLHGQFTIQGGDNNFNTAALVGGVYQPPYHTFFFQESLSGPLSKKASYSLGSNYRIIQDNNVVDTTTLGAGNVPTPFFQSVFFPQNRVEVSPRLDLQITPTNTLTARYQFEHNTTTNGGVGGGTLATAGYNSTETDNEIQLSDSQIFGAHVISETRFEYEHDASSTNAQNPQLTTSIQGAFTNFGAGTGIQSDTSNHWEVQSYTSVALANHFIRFGGRLRVNQDDNNSTAGHTGTFTYGQVTVNSAGAALLPTVGCTAALNNSVTGICNYAIIQQYGTGAYTYGFGPSQFNATYGNPALSASLADLGLYVEDDWKIRPSFTLSAGLRYETQNRIADHHDFAPRIAAAWGLLPRNGAPLFVLRGGFGIFYDRFGLGSWENTQRYNGSSSSEQQLTIANPNVACQDVNSCLTAYPGTATQVQYSQASTLRTPYTIQSSASLEHQMTKSWTMTATYLNSRGKHQFFSQNLRATGASTNNNYQYVSEGVFKQNQLILQSRYSGPWGTSLFGFYVLGHANGDTSGSGTFPSQPGNILADYGRTGFDVRQRLFFGGSAQLPWYITLSPFMIVNSGQPFNITVGQDLNGDNILNDRPSFGSCSGMGSLTQKYGCFNNQPATNAARIPINYAQGPAQFTFNLRATKTFGFGPLTAKGAAAAQSKKSQQAAGPGGPPPGGGPGGGGHGGGHGGGGGMGMGGGGTSTGHKYNLTFGAQGMNIFNVVNYSTPISVLSSPQYGQQTRLAGNIFSSNTAVRRVVLQASFTF